MPNIDKEILAVQVADKIKDWATKRAPRELFRLMMDCQDLPSSMEDGSTLTITYCLDTKINLQMIDDKLTFTIG